MSNDPARVVVAGWSGTANLGDELLLRALLGMLNHRGVHATVVSRRPEETSRLHGVAAIGLGDLPGLWGALRASAGMVLGPGGIIQDLTSPASLPWHLARVPTARAARVPVAGVGLGVGPLQRRTSNALVGRALRACRAVAVRDEASAQLLEGCGVPGVERGCDLALSFDPPEVDATERIVVCLRPWSPTGHVVPLRSLPRGALNPERTASLAAALDALAERTGLPLHLVAMDTERDVAFNDELAALVRSPVTVAAPTLDTVLGEVARSRLVVAMRFHAVVAALLGARPVVAVGYAPKVTSLAAEMGEWAERVDDTSAGHAQVANAGVALLERAGNADATGDLAAVHHRLAGGPRGLCAHERALDRLLEDT